ncbi:acyltransferase-like protein [Lotmaria passim]
MQSSTRPHDSVFLGSPEFRDGDAKSGASLVFPCAANEDVPMEKDTLMSLVGRRLVHVELTSIITVTLLYGIALVSAWLLSLVVRVHGDQFPSGALTPLQLTAFSLCFFAVGLHSTNVVYVWLRCSCEAAATLRAACEVSAYLLLFFVCDRTTLLERRPRVFNADVFFFLVFAFAFAAVATARRVCVPSGGDAGQGRGLGSVLLPVAAAAASVPPPASVSLLDRHHVEEWVGWVQLIYVMYGYFHNVHIYRMMRVCVSSYAFLTAFVNYARYDSSELSLQQSVVMLLRSLWKLNFVVVATCALLRNQYMLYHICAVQSFVTVAVYLLMNVGPLPRSSRRVFGVKVGVAAVLCCVLWDMPFSPEAFALLWSPMQRLVRYDNPIVDVAPLHEWLFRSGLDHWIWLVGVLVASRAPLVNRLLRRLDGQRTAGIAIKVAAAFAAGGRAGCVRLPYRGDEHRRLQSLLALPFLGSYSVRGDAALHLSVGAVSLRAAVHLSWHRCRGGVRGAQPRVHGDDGPERWPALHAPPPPWRPPAVRLWCVRAGVVGGVVPAFRGDLAAAAVHAAAQRLPLHCGGELRGHGSRGGVHILAAPHVVRQDGPRDQLLSGAAAAAPHCDFFFFSPLRPLGSFFIGVVGSFVCFVAS